MDIEVPSNWQLALLGTVRREATAEGNKDVPVYTNIKYPFDPVRLRLMRWMMLPHNCIISLGRASFSSKGQFRGDLRFVILITTKVATGTFSLCWILVIS